jgi:hypothetical protein
LADEGESEDKKPKTNKSLDYILASFIFIASFIAASIPSNENPERNATNTQEQIAEWTRVVAKWTRWLVVVGAVVGAITAAILFVQTYAFIQSERASLVVGHFQFPEGLAVNKQMMMFYEVRNSGKSIAQITNASINVKPELVYPLQYTPVAVLAPTQIAPDSSEEFTYLGLSGDAPYIVTQVTVDALNRGAVKLFVYGFVDYDDDFWFVGSKRSYFCFQYMPERSSKTVTAFSGCPVPRTASQNEKNKPSPKAGP